MTRKPTFRALALILPLVLTTSLASNALAADAVSGASHAKKKATEAVSTEQYDATTSASIVPEKLRQKVKATGFTDSTKKKVLVVIGDPRTESLEWDMVNTAVAHFEARGLEVEVRDLYALDFNPVMTRKTFFNAKDGFGKTPKAIAVEQGFVKKADHIIFAYPNWHDSPNAITKGYIERVFAKEFAYRNKPDGKGLEGLLKGKTLYTIMNAGWVGQGRGDVGDGISKDGGKSNPIWDKYLSAYKVVDDDTAGFWAMQNLGRFVNDQTPRNDDPQYKEKVEELRKTLRDRLDRVYGLK